MINCIFEDGGKGRLRHIVVDTLVLQETKVLLVKRTAKLLEANKWGLVGGFVDRDETIEDAVAREALEETGWKVTDITLLRINDSPQRPHEDRQNVAFVYFCKATKKVGEGDWESDEQQWFDLADLPAREVIAFDHFDNLQLYRRYVKQPFALPQLG